MSKYNFLIIVIVIVIVLIIFSLGDDRNPALEDFAKCLARQGAVMYGADWCSHCENQKKVFGAAFKFIPYIECPDNPELCLEESINGFPTWIFPASPAGGPDGKKLEGEQSLENLAAQSGCEIPKVGG